MRKLAFCFLSALSSAYPQESLAVSYTSLEDRFRYYLHRTYTSRQRLAFLIADSGVGHLLNDPEEWGREPKSFGRRLGSNFGTRVVRNTIEFGLGRSFAGGHPV